LGDKQRCVPPFIAQIFREIGVWKRARHVSPLHPNEEVVLLDDFALDHILATVGAWLTLRTIFARLPVHARADLLDAAL
jgi:hypothetical protein